MLIKEDSLFRESYYLFVVRRTRALKQDHVVLKVKREETRRNEKSSEWDTDTMGSRVVPSGVGPLNNSLSHPITPELPHLYPLHTSPPSPPPLPLCSVGVTPLVAPQWHHRYLFMGEWWEGETEGVVGRSSRGGFRNQCAYFMGAPCRCSMNVRGCHQMWSTTQRNIHKQHGNGNVGIYLMQWIKKKGKPESQQIIHTGHCVGFDLRWVTLVVMGAKRAGEGSEKWSIFGSTPALLMLRRCSQRSKTTGADPPPLPPITNASSSFSPRHSASSLCHTKGSFGEIEG